MRDGRLGRLGRLDYEVDSSSLMIASLPFFSTLTFPVPDIASYSHEPFHANDRLAAVTFQVTYASKTVHSKPVRRGR